MKKILALLAGAIFFICSPANAQFVPTQVLTAAALNAALAAPTITGGTITGLSSPIPVASGGTGAMTATGATSNLQFQLPFSNSVVRTVAAKLADSASILDFNSSACSGSDDTATIQNALTSLAGSGRNLQLTGSCLAGALTIPSGTGLAAAPGGATLKVSAAAPQYFLTLSATASNVSINGITLDGTNTPTNGALIYAASGSTLSNIYIQNNHFKNLPTTNGANNHAVVLNGAASAYITGNVVDQSAGDSLNFNGGYYVVTGNRVSNSGDGGIAFNNGARGSISNNIITRANLGVGAGPEGSQSDTDIQQNIIVSGNTFDTCNNGINFGWFSYAGRSAPVNWQIVGNTFRDNQSVDIEYDGATSSAVANGTISGNTFYGSGSTAYGAISPTTVNSINLNNASNVSITGNSFYDPKGTANTQGAISIQNGLNHTITGNTIYDDVGGHYKYTIYTNNSQLDTINNNSLNGVGYGIVLDGSPSMQYTTVSGNAMLNVSGTGIYVTTSLFYASIIGNSISGGSSNPAVNIPGTGNSFLITNNQIHWSGGGVAISNPSNTWTSHEIAFNNTGGTSTPPVTINGYQNGLLPAYTTSGATISSAHTVVGTASLSSGTATVTLSGSAVFTSNSSFSCAANDYSNVNPVKVSQSSGTSITFIGTGTDGIQYLCTGN